VKKVGGVVDTLDRASWSATRVEALSDGVFAIVMTLLVLELKVPQLPRDAPAADVWHGFRELGPIFFSYFVTFALAGAFWYRHHRVFHELTHVNAPVFALNLTFLSLVSLLPFSTAMLGAFKLGQPVSLACYFGNLFGLAVALSVLWIYVERAGLLKPTRDPASRRRVTFVLLAQVGAGLAALVMIAFEPKQAMNVYVVVLGLSNVLVRRVTRSTPTLPATVDRPD
jgi:uncharacterized membrane protein